MPIKAYLQELASELALSYSEKDRVLLSLDSIKRTTKIGSA